MIRAAIVDDHFVVRFGIKAMLDNQPDISFAGEASNALDVVGFVRATHPDVLLLDIRMPERDGIDALREIMGAFPNQKVIMLTTSEADNDVYQSLSLGAKGYLLKDRDSRAIVNAVRTVAAGGKFVPDAVRDRFKEGQLTPELTRRESDVLALVVDGLSNEEISTKLDISYAAVKFHVSNLLMKLDCRDRVALATSALRRGFVKSAIAAAWALAAISGGLFAAPQVKLLDSPFRDNAMRESRFMKGIDARALTRMFRVTAGLETREADEGKYEFLKGWEEDTIELRGHTCGHWMSGMASLYELTGDDEVKARAAIVVHTLAECQKANGNGYVSAFPESDIDKIIAGTRVWAPWYVIHKIFAGLLDQYLVCGNEEALAVAKGLGDWTAAKVLPLSDEQAATMRKREFGGIAESLVVLADITKDEKYIKAAEVFREKDLYKQINGKHANTLIPKVIADVRYGERVTGNGERVTGNRVRVEKFWDEVIGHYMYAPGCVSTKESFRGPDRQGDFLTGVTGETCCTYNLLKLSRLLWSPARADIADYQERAVWNHILGQMEPIDGHLTYFMPVMTGSYKLQSRPNNSFWCCCGSAMESHTKYQRLVCEEADGALYINNFIPSEIKWKGLLLRLETKFPAEEKAKLIVVDDARAETQRRREVIMVRRPFWSLAAENAKDAKSFYEVHEKVWKKGDVIDIPLPCKWRTESVVSKDGVKHTAVFYGPILMAARLGIEGMRKDATRSCNYYAHDYSVPEKLRSVKFESLETWKRLSPPPPYDRGMDGASPEVPEPFVEPTFMTPSGLVVSPYWAIHGERLCVYFD